MTTFFSKIPSSKILLLVWFISFSVFSAMIPVMFNVWETWMQELVNILGYHSLPNSLEKSPLVFIYYFETSQYLMTISVFQPVGKNVFTPTLNKIL